MTPSPAELEGLIREAVEAHTDLNIFASVVAILEGGTVSSGAQPDDFKVIRLCKEAEQRCLRRYDRAVASLRTRLAGEKG